MKSIEDQQRDYFRKQMEDIMWGGTTKPKMECCNKKCNNYWFGGKELCRKCIVDNRHNKINEILS